MWKTRGFLKSQGVKWCFLMKPVIQETHSDLKLCVVIQLVFRAGRAVYNWKGWKEKIKGISSLLHSCLSRHQTCVVSHLYVPVRDDKRDRFSLPKLYNIKGAIIFSLFRSLSLSFTLSTVISSSASAVVSSSSVLACCSWLSRAWRAACRLLIWDSRSCSDRVSSVTWRLISSFCSSCSNPIYKGKTEKVHSGSRGGGRWVKDTLTWGCFPQEWERITSDTSLLRFCLESLCSSFLLHFPLPSPWHY